MKNLSEMSTAELQEIQNRIEMELEDRMVKEPMIPAKDIMYGDFLEVCNLMEDYVEKVYEGEEIPSDFKGQLFNKIGEIMYGPDFVTWLYRQG